LVGENLNPWIILNIYNSIYISDILAVIWLLFEIC